MNGGFANGNIIDAITNVRNGKGKGKYGKGKWDKKRGAEASAEEPTAKVFKGLDQKKCYHCGKMGHIAANCPDKE